MFKYIFRICLVIRYDIFSGYLVEITLNFISPYNISYLPFCDRKYTDSFLSNGEMVDGEMVSTKYSEKSSYQITKQIQKIDLDIKNETVQ